jgi:hypothetical protein
MLGFLVDNISVFGKQVFQQSDGIPMGTNLFPLLADLFCIQMKHNLFRNGYRILKKKQKPCRVLHPFIQIFQ